MGLNWGNEFGLCFNKMKKTASSVSWIYFYCKHKKKSQDKNFEHWCLSDGLNSPNRNKQMMQRFFVQEPFTLILEEKRK